MVPKKRFSSPRRRTHKARTTASPRSSTLSSKSTTRASTFGEMTTGALPASVEMPDWWKSSYERGAHSVNSGKFGRDLVQKITGSEYSKPIITEFGTIRPDLTGPGDVIREVKTGLARWSLKRVRLQMRQMLFLRENGYASKMSIGSLRALIRARLVQTWSLRKLSGRPVSLSSMLARIESYAHLNGLHRPFCSPSLSA